MLNADQVKSELDSLIARYPEKTGAVSMGEFGKNCVYFLDEDGEGLTETFVETDQAVAVNLVTPVCIVGHWIHEFHPELKDNPAVRTILVRNSLISSVSNLDENPLEYPVLSVLRDYQMAQDDERVPNWAAIPSLLGTQYGIGY